MITPPSKKDINSRPLYKNVSNLFRHLESFLVRPFDNYRNLKFIIRSTENINKQLNTAVNKVAGPCM